MRRATGLMKYTARLRVLTVCVIALALTACAAQSHRIESTALADLGASASQVSDQTELAFTSANDTVRSASIERFIRNGDIGLNDASFRTAVDRDALADWQKALASLEEYSSTIASLIGEERSSDTAAAFQKLGDQVLAGEVGQLIGVNESGTTQSAKGLFADWAGKLVAVRTQQSAREIMLDADPQIRALLTKMADAIGRSDTDGLRGTVNSAQIDNLAPLVSAYARAATNRDADEQREIIAAYLAQRARDKDQLDGLATVRKSLLRLAEAHSSAARGQEVSLAARLDDISENLGRVRELLGSDDDDNAGTASEEE